MTDDRDALREQLAALAHTQWTEWMTYALSRCVRAPSGGGLIIPAEWMERWQRQVEQAYADLPAHDKESDRKEADRVLALLPLSERDALLAALVQEYAAILGRRGYWRHAMTGDETSGEAQAAVLGGREALLRVAARLGVTDLHDQAADVVARGTEGQP